MATPKTILTEPQAIDQLVAALAALCAAIDDEDAAALARSTVADDEVALAA